MRAEDASRILIVDDVEENLKVLSETLLEEGYYPLQAKSGERACQIAKKAQPDLILLDIKMPGMDGFETIKHLKEDADTASIPVIFISALNQIEDKVTGFKAGAVDYVSKPFQKEEVLARVGTHLKLRKAQREIEIEREKSERLLYSILPCSVAEELKRSGTSEPQLFQEVTILFSDLVDFTEKSAKIDPATLLGELNDIFSGFDLIMRKHDCERIKTIGDAYFAVCGIPQQTDNHALKMVEAAKEIRDFLEARNKTSKHSWTMRIGIHSGPAIAGIVGTDKYIYDVFGDSVNTASRMESNSEPMKINISDSTAALLPQSVQLEKRPSIDVKGKGTMGMFFVH